LRASHVVLARLASMLATYYSRPIVDGCQLRRAKALTRFGDSI
jgi:hypothetical protein